MNILPDKMASIQATELFTNPDKTPSNDWHLSKQHASFLHQEECEFIFFVNGLETNELDREDTISFYKEVGFSDPFVEILKEAQKQGYDRILIWS